MRFQCNHCHRLIDVCLWGEPEIRCYCGARYTKYHIVEVREKVDAS